MEPDKAAEVYYLALRSLKGCKASNAEELRQARLLALAGIVRASYRAGEVGKLRRAAALMTAEWPSTSVPDEPEARAAFLEARGLHQRLEAEEALASQSGWDLTLHRGRPSAHVADHSLVSPSKVSLQKPSLSLQLVHASDSA